MRKTLVTAAVATALSAGAFLTSANAMTLAAPAGLRPAIEGTNVAEPTRYVCWRRHGVRRCSWRQNRVVVGAYPYAGYPYYGYGYPTVGIGVGPVWGGWGWGWGGGNRVVVNRTVVRRGGGHHH